MKTKKIRKQLQKISNNTGCSIRREVAREALLYDTNPKEFFSNLFQHGCISGMVTSLIYYKDTHAFFLRHYQEIEEIRQNLSQEDNLLMDTQGDLMNYLSWFAFEETARKLAVEVGILNLVSP